jgi:hypothetical protein
MEDTTLSIAVKLGQVLSFFIVPLLGYVSYVVGEIKKQTISMNLHLQTLNGRLTRVETKLEDHERYDNMRFSTHHSFDSKD